MLVSAIFDVFRVREQDHLRGAYLHWIVEHAGFIVDLALLCLSIGAFLELWEWVRTIGP